MSERRGSSELCRTLQNSLCVCSPSQHRHTVVTETLATEVFSLLEEVSLQATGHNFPSLQNCYHIDSRNSLFSFCTIWCSINEEKNRRAIRKILSGLHRLSLSVYIIVSEHESWNYTERLIFSATLAPLTRWLPDVRQPLQMTSLFSLLLIAHREGKPLAGWHEGSSFQTATDED